MNTRNLNPSAEVEIISLTKKGHGLGKIAGKTQLAEVPFSIPGDKVQASLHRKRGGIYSSSLEEVLAPSPLRIQPRCIHFGTCGGCRWQQMSYPDQLKIKQAHIEKLFLPLSSTENILHPIMPCEPPWEYRNKMEFSFSGDASGRQFLGLFINGSRGKVLNLQICHLVHPWFVKGLETARQWWRESGLLPYHPPSNKGALRTLILREGIRTGDRLAMLTVSGNPNYALDRKQLDAFVALMRDAVEPESPASKLCLVLRIQQTTKGQETNFYEMILYGPDHVRETLFVKSGPETIPLAFNISPSAFFQPNTLQAERLYGRAIQLLEIPRGSVVYDLFCGTGTLGICAAKDAKQVVGIELSPDSSLDARANAAANGLKNVAVLTGPVRETIAAIRQTQSHPLPDIVIIDPPRVGLDKQTIRHLAELKPSKILYISCNPDTQAQNVAEILPLGYRITAVQPVDQFPHTVHIENIVVMQLNRE